MKKLLATAAIAAVALFMAGGALAFVHYPNASCPDTLSIIRLKTLLNTVASCAPQSSGTAGAPGDTVNGVGGIIIGFDEIPTGFDIYMEQSAGGVNSGIDVFTHGTNFRAPYGFNRGDSIVVEYAVVANYFGDVELESPNNNFSNPNIVLRKVSTGNPQPAFLDGTTTDFKETPTNTYIAQYMTTLVHLVGPVHVARLTGLSFHGMLVVSDAAPSDSVFVDYAKLTNLVPPPVGTVLSDIYGIVNNASRGYRIMPRDAHDVVDTQPPGLTDAYAVSDNQYRIVFDRDVTPATATDVASIPPHYTLASFGSVDAAVMDGTNAVILTVSTGLARGASETVTVNGVTGVDNGVTITTPVQLSFIAGLLTCGETSAPNPDSLAATPCRDVSKYVGFITKTGQYTNGDFGPRSTMTGIVAGIYGNLYYMEDTNPTSPAGNHRGVTVFAPPVALTLGHQYTIAGADEEYYSENEFAAITYVKDTGTPGVPAAIPLSVHTALYDTCDVNQNIDSARDYLSELVTLTGVKVVQRYVTPTTTGFHVVGPASTYADTVYIENQNNVLGTYVANNPNYPAVGSFLNVTGVVHYTTNTSTPSFRVCPRTAADITILGTTGVTPSTGKLSFSVFPNPARTVNVSFSLPHATNVQLNVYDLFGRKVATLSAGHLPAGTYTKTWAGLDDGGQRVHSGVYFYRLRAGDEVRTARTMLVAN